MGDATETVLLVGGPYGGRRIAVEKGAGFQVYHRPFESPLFYDREDGPGGEPRFVFSGTSVMRDVATGEPIRMEWNPNEPKGSR